MAGHLILSIETATGCGSVSLTRGGVDNGIILAEATAQPEVTHSRRLLGSVEWVKKAASVDWQEVDAVAVSLGPGSFTGLRIGMAAAKGLALAMQVPLVGVQTLDAMALVLPIIDRPLWCLLDARKQQIYAARYKPGIEDRPERVGQVEVMYPQQLVEKIDEPSILLGPGVDEYYDLFESMGNALLIPSSLGVPVASRLGFLASGQLEHGEIMDSATAAPLYVRASEAEINLEKKRG